MSIACSRVFWRFVLRVGTMQFVVAMIDEFGLVACRLQFGV